MISSKKFNGCMVALVFALAACSRQPASAPVPAPAKPNPIVTLETNQGIIKLKLFPGVAPKTCENFVGLVKKGYYDGLTFHRVIPDFMIQGGDPTATGAGGVSLWGGEVEDEVRPDVKFDGKGKLAMANAGPNTNGSQFFITVAPFPSLNMHYSLFGEVISGQDVVDKIDHVPTDARDRPLEKQYIIRATVATE
jgi:peptidylprolyl isomerase